MNKFALFTDVSLNPKLKIGAGAYLFVPLSFIDTLPNRIEKSDITEKLKIQKFVNTSSTKLEVETVLWALEDIKSNLPPFSVLQLFTDSQCVAGLLKRRQKLTTNNFISKTSKQELSNSILYQKFYQLYDKLKFDVIKVAGHSESQSHDSIHRIFSFVDREVRHAVKCRMKDL